MKTLENPPIPITSNILNLIASIDEFKGRWVAMKTLAPDRLNGMKQIATIESIGSSTRIEGVKLTDLEIEHLLKGLDVRTFQSRDEEEVAGYAHAMDLVYSNFAAITLTENHIKQLHYELLQHSSKDSRHRGEYKKHPNNVEAFDETGKSIGVIFETTMPFETPQQMTELVAWTTQALETKDSSEALHPLLVIAMFAVRFLAIHPFQDGNGRLSRVLTTLLLLQQGYDYVPYASLERIVEDNKDGYYSTLRETQKTLEKEVPSDAWVVFFLQCLNQQCQRLANKVAEAHTLKALSPLSEQILQLIKDHGRITVRDVETMTRANRNTIKVHIRDLKADGYLLQHGQGKGTWYTLKQ